MTARVDQEPATGTAAAEVGRLVLRERQSRDRGWWDDWAACFADDSVVEMSWFTGSGAEFVQQTELRSGDGVWGRHRVSPPAVRVRDDRAWAELPLSIEFHTTVAGVEADLTSYCRSQYRAQRIEGAWRIVRITSVYERDTLIPSVPGTILDLDPQEFASYRSSYRCLAWYLDRDGTAIAADLPGDDRPAGVAGVYAAERAWLDHGPIMPIRSTSTRSEPTGSARPDRA